MAESIEYDVKINTSGANKKIDDLNENIEDIGSSSKKATTSLGKTGKAINSMTKEAKGLSGAFKGGLGIGVAVKGIDMLTSGIAANAETQRTLSKIMVALGGVFNGFVEVLKPVFTWMWKAFAEPKKWWTELVDAFQRGTKWIKVNMIDLVLNKFTEWANNTKISVLELQKAWNEFTGDTKEAEEIGKKIDNIKKENIKLAQENAKKMTEIKAVTNDVVTFVTTSIDKIAKSTKKAVQNADFVVDFEKNMGLLQNAYQGIVETYDNLAEKQRQVRDLESNTLEDRMAANEELAKILDEGEAKEKKNIDARIGMLKKLNAAQFDPQRIVEIDALEKEITGVTAKYTGLRSEQQANINALTKEGIDIKKGEAEAIIEANKIISDSELLALEGTQSYYDKRAELMQKDYEAKKALLDQEILGNQVGTAAYQEAVNQKLLLEAQFTADSNALAKERTAFDKEQAEKKKETDKALFESRVAVAGQALSALNSLVGENAEMGKAIAVAQAVIDTYAGATKALAQGGTLGFVGAAAVVAAGLANVNKILSTDIPNSEGGSSAGANIGMPSVSMVQPQTNSNSQLAGVLGKNANKPTRAYVVGQDMSTQQSLDRHIQQNATF
jgi:hypothetical protein